MKNELCFQLLEPTTKKWNIYKELFNKIDKVLKEYQITVYSREFDDVHFQVTEIIEIDLYDNQIKIIKTISKMLHDHNLETELIYNKLLSEGLTFNAFKSHDIADCMKAVNKLNKEFKSFVKLITETNVNHNKEIHKDILNIYKILGVNK